MPMFPRIAGPCPYTRNLDDIIVGDMCRMCDRRVVDITDMSDAEKAALFTDCSETPCVRYTLPLAAMAASLALGTAAAAAPAQHASQHAQHHAAHQPPAPAKPIVVVQMPTAGVPAMPPQWEQHDVPPSTKGAPAEQDAPTRPK